MADRDVVLQHPNRMTPASRTTRASVIALLLASAALLIAVAVGGWSELQGGKPELVVLVLADLVMAARVAAWSRGVLPVAAAVAVIVGVFGAIAVPGWADRAGAGYRQTTLDASLLAALCGLLIPVSILLVVAALRGFGQAWNVATESPAPPRAA